MINLKRKITKLVAAVVTFSMVMSVSALASESKNYCGGRVTVTNVKEDKLIDYNHLQKNGLYHLMEKTPYITADSPVRVSFSNGVGNYYASDTTISVAELEGDKVVYAGIDPSAYFSDIRYDYAAAVSNKNGTIKIISSAVVPENYDPSYTPKLSEGSSYTINKPGIYIITKETNAIGTDIVIVDVKGEGEPAVPKEEKTDKTALLGSTEVTVNGIKTDIHSYVIDDNSYFRLYDIASAVNGSKHQFLLDWDKTKNIIKLSSGVPTPADSLVPTNISAPKTATATASTATVYINGPQVNFESYEINGDTYFKIRDMARALNFSISWNYSSDTLNIYPTYDYDN